MKFGSVVSAARTAGKVVNAAKTAKAAKAALSNVDTGAFKEATNGGLNDFAGTIAGQMAKVTVEGVKMPSVDMNSLSSMSVLDGIDPKSMISNIDIKDVGQINMPDLNLDIPDLSIPDASSLNIDTSAIKMPDLSVVTSKIDTGKIADLASSIKDNSLDTMAASIKEKIPSSGDLVESAKQFINKDSN